MTELFDFQRKSREFAVLGNPVAHSRSPQIHQLFAAQCDLDLHYARIQVDVGGFAQAVSHFFAHGGAGLNVTVPYKTAAWQLCAATGNHLSTRARAAEAVNTLWPDRGHLCGDNTDGVGLVRDLTTHLGLSLAGQSVLLLGAGGAAKGVVGALLAAAPRQLTIANRTPARAIALALANSQPADNVRATRLAEAHNTRYDLLINATAASLTDELPGLHADCLHPASVVYDLVYQPQPTVFMRWGLARGAAAAYDGLGMLVEQAAEAFFLWHAQRPQTAPVIAQLRASD